MDRTVRKLRATQNIAFFTLLAFLIATGETYARDWGWHRRSTPPDSGALRPDLEGIKEDSERDGTSELEEMRQWLRQRDEERRQLGVTIPDTVEQLRPSEDTGARLPQQADRDPSVPGSELTWGSEVPADRLTDDEGARVQETHYPRSSEHPRSRYSRRRTGSGAKSSSRHGSSSAYHARGGGHSKSSRGSRTGRKSGTGRRR